MRYHWLMKRFKELVSNMLENDKRTEQVFQGLTVRHLPISIQRRANARKPARFGRCRITDWRENAARRSFTVRCPTPVRCVPGVRSAIGSAVFAKMQSGASYASRSTRTSFAPLRRCRGTPIDGSGITKDAVHWSVSMPGSVATFSWNATICEGLKPCRCALR